MRSNIYIDKLISKDLKSLAYFKPEMIAKCLSFINNQNVSDSELDDIFNILYVSNSLYNNTSLNILILEDGVYDIVLEKYKSYRDNAPIGSVPIDFKINVDDKNIPDELLNDNTIEFSNIYEDLMFDSLIKTTSYNNTRILNQSILFDSGYISKRIKTEQHIHSSLAGSLDKCKFVMDYQARDKGVIGDPNVQILERDFFAKHIKNGIIDSKTQFEICIELKYDGIAIEYDVQSHTFRSRGDAVNNIASDLTPILQNYQFPNMIHMKGDFGVQFEAIMTKNDLKRFNIARGNSYSNCRTAIIGLFGSSDAADYIDYITLVPLRTSFTDIDKEVEINFLNQYFSKGIHLTHHFIYGTYDQILFQIKRFVDEAELLRSQIPFMYDGIVVSYTDNNIINKLGRNNAINKYSMAVKFNPIKKNSIFLGYTYTVGQDGSITPMIHYEPVEFFGTIHNKSTGHSFERFNTLSLKYKDIIDIEYVNDVMPYVSKSHCAYNQNNTNDYAQFITHCPVCNTELVLSKSGKTILCVNKDCIGRNLSRMTNMLSKLNFHDFSEATINTLSIFSFNELMSLKYEDINNIFGDITAKKFIDRVNEIKTTPIYDYILIGSLGFSNIGRRMWKIIFNEYTLEAILKIYELNVEQLRNILINIKGIGKVRANTIIDELDYFMKDIIYIINNTNIISSLNSLSNKKKIRMTGFRNMELINEVTNLGHDIGEGSVTKDTDFLLVPVIGHSSSKTKKAESYGVKIIEVNEFLNNIIQYLEN